MESRSNLKGAYFQIDSDPLPMDQWDELIFREALCDAISKRAGIGDALAEEALEAAKRWGRLDEDMKSGALRFPAWGSLFHWTLPCIEWDLRLPAGRRPSHLACIFLQIGGMGGQHRLAHKEDLGRTVAEAHRRHAGKQVKIRRLTKQLPIPELCTGTYAIDDSSIVPACTSYGLFTASAQI